MSNEFRTHHTATGATVYVVLARGTDGQVYKGGVYEAPLTANWSTYKIVCTEQSTTQLYYGNMPAAQAAGLYDVLFYLQAGGSPATTDTLLERRALDWNASAAASLGKYATGNTETLSLKTLNVVNSTGDAITASSTGGNGNGINASGNGTGSGTLNTGGATGPGLKLVGGATSGDGLFTASTNGHGFNLTGGGASKAGFSAVGAAASGASPAGPGMIATGGAASTTSGGTAGNGFTVTGGAGAATTNGSAPGMQWLGGGTATVFGNSGLSVQATGNADALHVNGSGSGDGFMIAGGATGHGINCQGGSTSGRAMNLTTTNGEGIAIIPTLGHGIACNANGTGKHGISIVAGGGGAADGNGINCITLATDGDGANFIGNGTGTDIRAFITGTFFGNIQGTVTDLSPAGLDQIALEAGLNARQGLALIAAAESGVVLGANGGATTITIHGSGVATTRVVANVDAFGNRTAVTLTPPP